MRMGRWFDFCFFGGGVVLSWLVGGFVRGWDGWDDWVLGGLDVEGRGVACVHRVYTERQMMATSKASLHPPTNTKRVHPTPPHPTPDLSKDARTEDEVAAGLGEDEVGGALNVLNETGLVLGHAEEVGGLLHLLEGHACSCGWVIHVMHVFGE